MAPSSTRSSRLELVPSRLPSRNGSDHKAPLTWPSWTIPRGVSSFVFWERSDLSMTVPATPQSSPNLTLIETEPWTPPSDAHPEISLAAFVKAAWPILEPAEPYVDSWYLGMFCEHAQAISTGQLA